jgi:hypothetical protein
MNDTRTPKTTAAARHIDGFADQWVPRFISEEIEREMIGWREAAYALAEALPPSWEALQPPAEQLRKFKEMVALQNEKTKKLLDIADKHSKMYP